jgi:hypothetical protein
VAIAVPIFLYASRFVGGFSSIFSGSIRSGVFRVYLLKRFQGLFAQAKGSFVCWVKVCLQEVLT